ncbi:hypothetical protein PENSPDRAFT_756897 [Peniophora sp. CONT]|nr:hypothetical protein PENSPDRAFT_756897 [Peniophora sp. CONT]
MMVIPDFAEDDLPVVDAQDIDAWLLSAQGLPAPKKAFNTSSENASMGDARRIVQVVQSAYGVQANVLTEHLHLPAPSDTTSATDSHINLPPGLSGISPSEFESYLKIVHHADSPGVTLTAEDWLSSHHIAHLCSDAALRSRALAELAATAAPHGAILAQIERYGLDDECASEVLKLVTKRERPLSAAEIACISPELALQVGEAQRLWEMKSRLHKKKPNMRRILEQVWGF